MDAAAPASPGEIEEGRDLLLIQMRAARDNAERLCNEAHEALRIRDEFLSSISHDLRNPLTTVKGYIQLARRRAERLSSPDADSLVEILAATDAAATRMERMVGELLDLTRLQTGRPLDLNLQVTDLVALVRRTVDDHQRTTVVHKLTMQCAASELIGAWDPDRLERVLSNLLSNAIKYSKGGAITVTLLREETSAGSVAEITVEDRGMGIPAVDLPHVFERFQRGSNVQGRILGSGIGLAGARQIVEQHGGTIDVASIEGAGSTFTVRLPIRIPSIS